MTPDLKSLDVPACPPVLWSGVTTMPTHGGWARTPGDIYMGRKYITNNHPGMKRPCSECKSDIVVTEKMCRRGNYRCVACESRRAQQWTISNREKKRALNRAYSSKHSGNRAQRTAAYRSRYPERRIAHQAVQTALRNKSLVRAQCEVCGIDNTEAHHDDYSKVLNVRWLCHKHHMELHWSIAELAKEKP